MTVHISETANTFHIVDQVSEWSEFCHRQYGRFFRGADGGLSERDDAMLARHRAVREKRGWGGGLEQTFYTPLDLDEAIKKGVEAGHLTEEEAEVERAVLTHFKPRAERLLRMERERLEAFRERLKEDEDLRRRAGQLSRFCGGSAIEVPVYLMANPADYNCGGGYNGGRLTIEIPRKKDAYGTFVHELMHAFVATKRGELQKAVEGVAGLDYQTLNEGIAYALSPGIVHANPDADPLVDEVREDLQSGRPLSDSYTRCRRFGLALRPLMREALEDEDQTLAGFLPRAVDAWRVVWVLNEAARPPVVPLRFVIDDSLKNPDGSFVNPNIPQFLAAVADRVKGLSPSSEEWVEIRLVRGEPGYTSTLDFDEEDGWICEVGTESAMSEGFITYLEGRVRKGRDK